MLKVLQVNYKIKKRYFGSSFTINYFLTTHKHAEKFT